MWDEEMKTFFFLCLRCLSFVNPPSFQFLIRHLLQKFIAEAYYNFGFSEGQKNKINLYCILSEVEERFPCNILIAFTSILHPPSLAEGGERKKKVLSNCFIISLSFLFS